MLLKLVLLHKKTTKRELMKATYILEDILACQRVSAEKLVEELTLQSVIFRHGAEHFNNLGKVVVCLAVVLTFSRIKQKIASYQLENHACEAPQVSTRIVIDSQHDFGSAILTSLDLRCKVMVRPTTVS